MAADKQQALVNSISDGVASKVAPEFAKVSEELAKVMVAVNACNARLAQLESTVGNSAAGSKGVARGGLKKPIGGKKPPAKGKSGEPDASKVTNSLLYFRYAMQMNIDDAQDIYGTEENLLEAEKDSAVGKRDKIKDPNGYWSTVGNFLWKAVLSEEQKAEVRTNYTAWKENAERDGGDAPLDEDDTSAP